MNSTGPHVESNQSTSHGGIGRVVHPTLLKEQSSMQAFTTSTAKLSKQASRRLSTGISYIRNASSGLLGAPVTPTTPNTPDAVDAGAAQIAHTPTWLEDEDEHQDNIAFSFWDTCEGVCKRALVIVYRSGGISLWNLDDIDNARELLNLRSWPNNVLCARLLPYPELEPDHDDVWKQGPLLAIVSSDPKSSLRSLVALYSLSCHKVVKKLQIKGTVVEIKANKRFMILACIKPTSLHIYATHDLKPLTCSPLTDPSVHPLTGHPVFDLSASRLLAYATLTEPSTPGSGILSNGIHDFETPLNILRRKESMPPVGETARRVGESLMSGVRAGYTYWASRSASPPESLLSKSAPHASPLLSPQLHRSPSLINHSPPTSIVYPHSADANYVLVLDLCCTDKATPISTRTNNQVAVIAHMSAVNGATHRCKVVAHFKPSPSHPVALISINPNGNLILTTSSEAQAFHIFEIRPQISISSTIPTISPVWHRYRLNRGLTVAQAQDVTWTPDSKHVAVSTGRGTLHLYDIQPTGGKPIPSTQLTNQVINLDHIPKLSVTLSAIARIRSSATFAQDQDVVESPLIESPSAPTSIPVFSPISLTESMASRTVKPNPPPMPIKPSVDKGGAKSPTTPATGRMLVDFLAFHPAHGQLLLERVTSKLNQAGALPTVINAAVDNSPRIGSGLTNLMKSRSTSQVVDAQNQGQGPMSLDPYVSASVVRKAVWHLGRNNDWEEMKMDLPTILPRRRQQSARWSAQAEIETFSRSHAVLPRSIYTSQQFVFQSISAKSIQFNVMASNPAEVESNKLSVKQAARFRNISTESEDNIPFDNSLQLALSSSVDHDSVTGSSPSSFAQSLPNGKASTVRWRDALPPFGKIANNVVSPNLQNIARKASIAASSLSPTLASATANWSHTKESPKAKATDISINLEDDSTVIHSKQDSEERRMIDNNWGFMDDDQVGSSELPPSIIPTSGSGLNLAIDALQDDFDDFTVGLMDEQTSSISPPREEPIITKPPTLSVPSLLSSPKSVPSMLAASPMSMTSSTDSRKSSSGKSSGKGRRKSTK